MDLVIELVKLASALVALAMAVFAFMSEARGSNDRKGKEEDR